MEKKRTELKVSQLFTEAKLSKLSVDELTKEMTSARENAKIRHYEVDFNVEELREGIKLTFHDNRIETVTSELELHNQSDSQNELARNSTRRDITVDDSEAKDSNMSASVDDIMKLQSNQTAGAPGQRENGSKQNVKDPTRTSLEYSPVCVKRRRESRRKREKCSTDGRSSLDTKVILKYDREFLLQFRNCAYALRKPEHLPDIRNIILNKPHETSPNERPGDFQSEYVWTVPASKKQSKSKVSSSELGAAELSTSSKFNGDLKEQSPVSVSQLQQTPGHVIRPTASIQQKMYGTPLQLPYQKSLQLPYQVPFAYPQSSTSQLIYPGQPSITRTNTQGVPFPNSHSGIPYSHPGHPQFPCPQFSPFGFGYGNQPPFIGIHANNQQTQHTQKVQVNQKRERKHILSIVDPVSLKDVTAEICKTAEREPQDSSSRSKTAEISKVRTTLNDLILRRKEDNKMVIQWIDSNVDASARKQPRFIRALMTVICYSAIKGKKGHERLEPKEINARNDLLQRYICRKSELELQALYAVQAVITHLEHPQGILRGLFDTLYDEDLISEDAFFQWHGSKDELNGKEECLKQSTQFFTWLIEAEEDS
ncbi:uncharacterized protein LOC123535690 isoform X1 [Mercenaria mercenaria]|uniref:uncharacterized protein LOC123535690 isoform X1 n=1 Tax=Mercenaria mercenaria TaxID=6596 RepID=UPI00234F2DB1|nr:uncharacterized protein LOC123535690 isoform X1 [Mercenaria mercenaria]